MNSIRPLARRLASAPPVALAVMAGCWVFVCAASVRAQEPEPQQAGMIGGVINGEITLNLPDEIEVQALVDLVSTTLDVNIFYDESIRGKKVSLRSPVPVPRQALMDLLRNVLAAKGFVLVAAETPGWWRVIPAEELQRHVVDIREQAADASPERGEFPARDESSSRIITQLIPVRGPDAAKLAEILRPFLGSKGAAVVPVEGARLLMLTDNESAVRRMIQLVRVIDVAPRSAEIQVVRPRHTDAGQLAARVSGILSEKSKIEGPGARAVQAGVIANPTDGTLTLIGLPDALEEVRSLIREFDRPTERAATGWRLERYVPKYVSAERVLELVRRLSGLEEGTGTAVQLFVDAEANALYVRGPATLHAEARGVITDLDSAPFEARRPIRFYQPLNRKAADLFGVLVELLGSAEPEVITETIRPERPRTDAFGPEVTGPNVPAAGPGVVQVPPVPPAMEAGERDRERRIPASRVRGDDYTLTLDEQTNTIIAVATPQMHALIQQLIDEQDVRRPQVLVEATLVAVDISDGLDLGIELEQLDLGGDGTDHLLFSSFGLSTIDPTSGARSLIPGVGFNGVLIRPDQVPIIIRALATSGRARVVSMPKILVLDNDEGTLESVSEQPFTSVNASDTVATTSFAGFVKAGTQLRVTPHIAEGDHLELRYDLTVSSFAGGGGDGTTPPPRSSNTISSTVVVPDGHTVVVGGLILESESDTLSEVPLLGRIPILGMLFQSSSKAFSRTRLYAFIRPVILRDDQFEYLRYLSESDLEEAELANADYPQSTYEWMD